MKPKKVHERNGGICKAPVCRTCGAGHHLMLCEAVQEKKQMLKTGEEDDEDDDSEESEDDNDEDHIRYLQEAYGRNDDDESKDSEQEEQGKANDEEEDPINLPVEDNFTCNLRKMNVPTLKKENKTDEWWKQVCEVYGNNKENKTTFIESSQTVTGNNNIRLLSVAKANPTQSTSQVEKLEDENEMECKINKVQKRLEDRDGEIEQQLLEDLFSVRHKWKNRNEAVEFKKKYNAKLIRKIF